MTDNIPREIPITNVQRKILVAVWFWLLDIEAFSLDIDCWILKIYILKPLPDGSGKAFFNKLFLRMVYFFER